MSYRSAAAMCLLVLLGACTNPSQETTISGAPSSTVVAGSATQSPIAISTPAPSLEQNSPSEPPEQPFADVTKVSARGYTGAYAFSVTILSPDTGCTQYADWWEVLTPEGELIYRRVLAHSHTDEQPFTRSGSPFEMEPGQTVIVRAHMSTSGYGAAAMRGSVASGFHGVTLGPEFAPDAADEGPLPDSCAF